MTTGRLVSLRLDLPPEWYALDLDDPDACMQDLVAKLLGQRSAREQEALAEALFMEYGLLAFGAPLDLLVLIPHASTGIRATLTTSLTQAHTLLRRNLQGYAGRVAQDMRALGARKVGRTEVLLPSGPSVRLRAVTADDLGRRREMVVHVVVPPGADGAVLLRLQWEPDRDDSDELAGLADEIAGTARIEVLD